jgi:hypothetical protein
MTFTWKLSFRLQDETQGPIFVLWVVGKVDNSDLIRVQDTIAGVLPCAIARIEPLRSI